MSSFKDDNAAFEKWLHTQTAVVEADLNRKHKRMRKNAFTFLRATFFRWARKIEILCPELKDAPIVLSVGDMHLENFGTWRDDEGRLVWGVNDFDEAAAIPYPFDLVRLVASARLAPGMHIANHEVAKVIMRGYRRGLATPRPTFLDEQEIWMRPHVECRDKERKTFWEEIGCLPTVSPPADVAANLNLSVPQDAEVLRFASRTAGDGSLGRSRYVVVANWRGSRVVREAKALVPSAWEWAHGNISAKPWFADLAGGKYRSPDPFLHVRGNFIFRRIGPDFRKVELGEPGKLLEVKLLEAMGFDLGAIHAADALRASAVKNDLAKRRAGWLYAMAKVAALAVEQDYERWKR